MFRLTYLSEAGEVTQRTVEPYGLVGRYGRWTWSDISAAEGGFRTFRLDRIKMARPVDEQFTRREDF